MVVSWRDALRCRLLCLVVASGILAMQGNPYADDGSLADLSVEEITDLYVEIAFGSENLPAQDGDELNILKRDPSRPVYFVPLPKPSTPFDESVALLKSVVETIQVKSPSMKFLALDESELAAFIGKNRSKDFGDPLSDWPDTILVYFGSKDELRGPVQANAEKFPQLFSIFEYNSKYDTSTPFCAAAGVVELESRWDIGFSIAWIEYGNSTEACLYEELMQSFGMAQDFPPGTPSIFNDDGVYSKPTDFDWLLWKIHMDSRIKSGMNEAEVRAVVPTILTDFEGY